MVILKIGRVIIPDKRKIVFPVKRQILVFPLEASGQQVHGVNCPTVFFRHRLQLAPSVRVQELILPLRILRKSQEAPVLFRPRSGRLHDNNIISALKIAVCKSAIFCFDQTIPEEIVLSIGALIRVRAKQSIGAPVNQNIGLCILGNLWFCFHWSRLRFYGRLDGLRLCGHLGGLRLRRRLGGLRLRGRLGGLRLFRRLGGLRLCGCLGGLRLCGRLSGLRLCRFLAGLQHHRGCTCLLFCGDFTRSWICGILAGFRLRGRLAGFRLRGRLGGLRFRRRLGGLRLRGRLGGFRLRGRLGGFRLRGRLGGLRLRRRLGRFWGIYRIGDIQLLTGEAKRGIFLYCF